MKLPRWRDDILAAWPLMSGGRGWCVKSCLFFLHVSVVVRMHKHVFVQTHIQFSALASMKELNLWLMKLIYGSEWEQGEPTGWVSELQSRGTRTILTSPLFTEWSEQPKGCWLENNKCCYWWLPSEQVIANSCLSLSIYCSHGALDRDKAAARHPATVISIEHFSALQH